MQDINDYLIDITDFDWKTLLENWSWLLPKEFTIWFVNKFGDLFLIFEDDAIYQLLTDTGELKRIADSRDHFATLLEENNNANHWLMIPLVDKLASIDINLHTGQCFGYKQLPIVGGLYTLENISVILVNEYYPFLGDVYRQIKDLPDGTKIHFKVT